jgi:CoA:oxalate CoA-transferase
MSVVEEWTRQRTVDECVSALEAAGVPCAAYADPGDALVDPHLLSRGLFSEIADGAGAFTGVNPPWRMSGSRAELRDRVPAVGERGPAALRDWLGLTDADVQSLGFADAAGHAP